MLNKMAEKIKAKQKEIEERKSSKALLIPAEIQQERMNICNDCEFLYKKTNTCKKCMCFMGLKTYLPYAKCPLGKWGKYGSWAETEEQ